MSSSIVSAHHYDLKRNKRRDYNDKTSEFDRLIDSVLTSSLYITLR